MLVPWGPSSLVVCGNSSQPWRGKSRVCLPRMLPLLASALLRWIGDTGATTRLPASWLPRSGVAKWGNWLNCPMETSLPAGNRLGVTRARTPLVEGVLGLAPEKRRFIEERYSANWKKNPTVNTLKPRQNGHHIPEDLFKFFFFCGKIVSFGLKFQSNLFPMV